ncbi:hypothetical protein BBP40_003663 [Aspergillus hancockii]|nr:hypothetical protein BBP40_003663 [Aspergillus hancockii]
MSQRSKPTKTLQPSSGSQHHAFNRTAPRQGTPNNLDPGGPEIVPIFKHDGPKGSSNSVSSNNGNVSNLFKGKPSASLLRIPSFPDVRHEDLPASPFSFEKSPTITIAHRFYAKETEDEGISVSDDDKPSGLGRNHSQGSPYSRILSHSQRKVDSGYSSAASVRSLQDNRTRASMESQESQRPSGYRRFTLGGSKDLDICNVQNFPELCNQIPMNRHLSLECPMVCSRGDPNGWLADMTTMCHETPQLWVNGRSRSLSYAAPQSSNRTVSPQYCAQLRRFESSAQGPQAVSLQSADDALSNIQLFGGLAVLDAKPDYSRGTMGTETNRRKTGRNIDGDMTHKFNPHRSASAKKLVKKTPNNGQAPQTIGPNATTRCLESETKAPLTPISQRPETTMAAGCVCPESPRGRARSRTIDLERRMSAQHQKPPNIYVAASPLIYH